MKSFTSWALLALVVTGSVGCSSSGVESSSGLEKESAEAPGLPMTLLARIERSSTDVVSFYDTEIGIVISETGLAEEANEHASFDELRAQGMTAAFRTLSRDDRAQVPSALLAAENVWLERRAALARNPAPAVAAPPGAVEPIQKTLQAKNYGENTVAYTGGGSLADSKIGNSLVRTGTGEAVGSVQNALGGAATDAAWWQGLPVCQYTNTNSAGQIVAWYDGVWCVTDTTWAQTSWRDTMYYEVTAFGQGNYASVKVNKWINGAWAVVTNTTVPYRYFQTFSYPPENGAYYNSYVSGNGGQTIGIAERYRLAMPMPGFVNNKPSDVEYDFANDIQGITHDANNWFLTRTKYKVGGAAYGLIAKVPLTTSLNNAPTGYGMPSSWNRTSGGSEGSRYNHFGDVVQVAGRVYVGMDGPAGAAVGIYDTNLNAITYIPLSNNSGAPGIAYNPKDGLFYVPSDSSHFQKYQIGTSTATWKGTLTLSQPYSGGFQGGKFSPKGNLWIHVNGAFYAVDGANGAMMVGSGYSLGNADEGEGLDILDLDADTRPGMAGQLHLQLLDNNIDDDNWYLMHWRAPMGRL